MKLAFAIFVLVLWAVPAAAQGGPPLLTTDPDPPGAQNLEVNIGVMPVLRRDTHNVQTPQFDINYGIGENVQLTYEVPFVWQSAAGQPNATGWSNGFVGVKWRFYAEKDKEGKIKEGGWKISTFPQIETGGPDGAVGKGIADGGTRFLLPIEISRRFGPVHVNFEGGYYFPLSSPRSHNERFFGLAVGHEFRSKSAHPIETIGEVFNDYVMGAGPKDTVFDAGARYTLHRSFILLFMAGRSFSPNSSGQPEFIAYAGIQILLDRSGRSFHTER